MGPLSGLRVIEIAGIGPTPFAGMMLADMGAEVLRIERIDKVHRFGRNAFRGTLDRGKATVNVDLKSTAGHQFLELLVARSDALIEGFRPGVMERLGLGPDVCLGVNPRLVYGRMTGWGQEGPISQTSGHDINYIALSGVLRNFARKGQAPVPPLNLAGDFGGGGMFLAFGVLCALLESKRSGAGQVVDAAMVDGSAALMAMTYSMSNTGSWSEVPGTNLLDTGAPFYDVYETLDGKYLAVGCIEQQFYEQFLTLAEIDEDPADQMNRERWDARREKFALVIGAKTQSDWALIFKGTDACVSPVLTMQEAPMNEHIAARGTFVPVGEGWEPAPAPRFSRTPGAISPEPAAIDTLMNWGIDRQEIEGLVNQKVITLDHEQPALETQGA